MERDLGRQQQEIFVAGELDELSPDVEELGITEELKWHKRRPEKLLWKVHQIRSSDTLAYSKQRVVKEKKIIFRRWDCSFLSKGPRSVTENVFSFFARLQQLPGSLDTTRRKLQASKGDGVLEDEDCSQKESVTNVVSCKVFKGVSGQAGDWPSQSGAQCRGIQKKTIENPMLRLSSDRTEPVHTHLGIRASRGPKYSAKGRKSDIHQRGRWRKTLLSSIAGAAGLKMIPPNMNWPLVELVVLPWLRLPLDSQMAVENPPLRGSSRWQLSMKIAVALSSRFCASMSNSFVAAQVLLLIMEMRGKQQGRSVVDLTIARNQRQGRGDAVECNAAEQISEDMRQITKSTDERANCSISSIQPDAEKSIPFSLEHIPQVAELGSSANTANEAECEVIRGLEGAIPSSCEETKIGSAHSEQQGDTAECNSAEAISEVLSHLSNSTDEKLKRLKCSISSMQQDVEEYTPFAAEHFPEVATLGFSSITASEAECEVRRDHEVAVASDVEKTNVGLHTAEQHGDASECTSAEPISEDIAQTSNSTDAILNSISFRQQDEEISISFSTWHFPGSVHVNLPPNTPCETKREVEGDFEVVEDSLIQEATSLESSVITLLKEVGNKEQVSFDSDVPCASELKEMDQLPSKAVGGSQYDELYFSGSKNVEREDATCENRAATPLIPFQSLESELLTKNSSSAGTSNCDLSYQPSFHPNAVELTPGGVLDSECTPLRTDSRSTISGECRQTSSPFSDGEEKVFHEAHSGTCPVLRKAMPATDIVLQKPLGLQINNAIENKELESCSENLATSTPVSDSEGSGGPQHEVFCPHADHPTCVSLREGRHMHGHMHQYFPLEELVAAPWSELVFWHGHCKQGRPTLCILLGKAVQILPAVQLSSLASIIVSHIEYAELNLFKGRVKQMNIVMDLWGLGLLRMPPMEILQTCWNSPQQRLCWAGRLSVFGECARYALIGDGGY